MKTNNEQLKQARSRSAIDIVCDKWEVDKPFRVAILRERMPLMCRLPSEVSLLPDGFRAVTLELNTDWSLATDWMEESLC